MNGETVDSDVRSFIVENFLFGQDDPGLEIETSFLERGIIDSTGVLELVGFLEGEYGIHVEDDDLIPDNLDSIQKVGAFVRRKLAARQG